MQRILKKKETHSVRQKPERCRFPMYSEYVR